MFWVVVVLVLAAALPFLGTLGNYFTGDDFAYVQLYGREYSPLDFLSLFWADWSQGIWGRQLDEIRPVNALFFWLDSRWRAPSPTSYHDTNIVLHVLNALVVLGIGRVVGLSLLAATFAGCLFAVLAIPRRLPVERGARGSDPVPHTRRTEYKADPDRHVSW